MYFLFIQASVEHRLDSVKIAVRNGSAVSVVLASSGYPGPFSKDKTITFGQVPPGACASLLFGAPMGYTFPFVVGVQVFHAGTTKNTNGTVVTSGGRVLVVSAFAPTLKEALAAAYKGVDAIDFEGKTFRRDIGHRHEVFNLTVEILV
jgi:phosphoribosylamine--glycine ligase / phosphoribosylformylglycinamidine cyclo-ligase